MIDLIIITVGKIKEDYWLQAQNEYLKRLNPYVRFKFEEIKITSFSKNQKEKVIKEESLKISNYLEKFDKEQIFLLSEQGKLFNSEQFANKITIINQPVVFVVGGSLGFDDSLKNKYNCLSLSPLTFPHEMARIILLEQIYRAISIKKGRDYHY